MNKYVIWENPEQAESFTAASAFNTLTCVHTPTACHTHGAHMNMSIFMNAVEEIINEGTFWSSICCQLLLIYTFFLTFIAGWLIASDLKSEVLLDISLTWLTGRTNLCVEHQSDKENGLLQQLHSAQWSKITLRFTFLLQYWLCNWAGLCWHKLWSLFGFFMNSEEEKPSKKKRN